MVPGSRPLLTLADTREPDYITPMLLAANPRAKETYERAMHDAWCAKNQLLDRGVPLEIALYVLPNAKSLRLYESGSLLHLLHKWTMRTCFKAQEDIFQASMDEVAQLREVHPELARYIGPPCHHRAGITTPICTEGSHFCGVKVWLDFPNTPRRISKSAGKAACQFRVIPGENLRVNTQPAKLSHQRGVPSFMSDSSHLQAQAGRRSHGTIFSTGGPLCPARSSVLSLLFAHTEIQIPLSRR